MNTYYGLRHGESQANTQGIIVSLPKNGLEGFGLTKHGAEQVAKSCTKFAVVSPIIIASDFKRTVQTASIAAAHYGVEYTTSPLLRERNFEAFELQPNSHYATVWHQDALNCTVKGVETTAGVAHRCKAIIEQLEKVHSYKTIILVSHGDTLQIMQCVLQGLQPALHRSLEHFNPGELRLFMH